MKLWSIVLVFSMTVFNLPPAWADTCSVGLPSQQMIPIPELTGTYKGFSGLKYQGSNDPPLEHDEDGQTLASHIVPRAPDGSENPNGKIVFLALGFSNATIEFCGGGSFFDPDDGSDDPSATVCPQPQRPPVPLAPRPCTVGVDCPYNQLESFMGKAFTENRQPPHDGKIVLVDGALGNRTLPKWDPYTANDPTCPDVTKPCYAEYNRVKGILESANLTEKQVQAIWFKSADPDPTVALPNANADAYEAETHLGNIIRAIRVRYPQARQVFISPRIYGGYANARMPPNPLNKEPFAYELGFSIKWLIDSQIQEMLGNPGDPRAGDLRYQDTGGGNIPATWIDWGPYLWDDGHNCATGFACLNSDMRGKTQIGQWCANDGCLNECTHPSTFGEEKVGAQLLDFMNHSAYTDWFRLH